MSQRDAVRQVDLAALLTELAGQPTGTNTVRWHCPDRDHADEDPSVTMFVDRTGTPRWKCWSGGHGGTAVDAIMGATGVSLADAFTLLEQREPGSSPPPFEARPRRAVEAKPLTRRIRNWVRDGEARIGRLNGAYARAFIAGRGIPPHIAEANRLGWQPDLGYGNNYGIPPHEAVIVPAFDERGELVYAQARNLDIRRANCKYTNPTPGHGTQPAVVFPRGAVTGGPVILTEGVLDGLTAVAAGYRAAAVFSTATCAGPTVNEIAERVIRHAAGDPIVLALDNDPAGRTAIKQLAAAFSEHGVRTRVLRLPDGNDLTSTWTRRSGEPATADHRVADR